MKLLDGKEIAGLRRVHFNSSVSKWFEKHYGVQFLNGERLYLCCTNKMVAASKELPKYNLPGIHIYMMLSDTFSNGVQTQTAPAVSSF